MPRTLERDPTIASEEHLIRCARSGDAAATGTLFDLHFGRIHALCCRLIAAPEDAEDLTQDVFIRAFRGLAGFHGRCAFGTWLYRIAVRRVQDHLRQRGTLSAMPNIELPQELTSSSPRPEQRAQAAELELHLRQEIEALPYRMRVAFLLRTFEAKGYSEISSILDVREGTARMYVVKARRRLGARLRPWLEGGVA